MRKLIGAILTCAALLPATIATAQTSSPVQGYGTNDGGETVLNILPPGQGRYMNGPELLVAQLGGDQPPHNTDQVEMYDSLVQATPGLTGDRLTDFFKDATFGVPPDDIAAEYSPREGLTILRDESFGVPHVYGETRSDVMFGAGYVSAEDRLFMMDTLRHVGRGRLSEFLGASEANLQMDRAAYAAAGYEEAEFEAMADRLLELDPVRGAQAIQDVQDYTEGVNTYIHEALRDPSKLPGEYEALQQVPRDWKPTDTAAVASLIGSQLGVGGGGELRNAAFLSALHDRGFSEKEARAIFDDLRHAEDPEAPTHTTKRFEWNNKLGPVDPASVAFPDSAEEAARRAEERSSMPGYIDGPFGRIRLAFPNQMSNAILVDAKHSESGRPIAVMGPQVGYWSPEILMELDLHGPGIDARGVGFPGISMYVLLGRGRDYAWSATSAGGDQVDIVAEELCDPDGGDVDPDGTFYVKDGECVEMYTRTDRWVAKPSAGGVPPVPPGREHILVEMTVERTDDGVVQSRGHVDGKPVAFVRKRSSFGGEVDGALTYVDIMDADKIRSAQDFQEAFSRFNFTFQWFYADERNIAWQLVGNHPIRARGTDPDLPVWGTGEWDWTGSLSREQNPNEIDPSSGYIISWNNKQAPGFRSNDAQWGYGSVHRSQMLSNPVEESLAGNGKLSLVDLVNIMGDAATVDLRGYRVLPYMLDTIGAPDDKRLADAVSLLQAWTDSGAHREAAEPGGDYVHAPAVALMDAWWEKAIEAIFKPTLGAAFDAIPAGFDNEPGPVGSAYQGGFYGHVEKDLRTILKQPVQGRYSRTYCGGGDLDACRAALVASLGAAVSELEEQFGNDPSSWEADEEGDRLEFTPLGVQGQDPIQWQNRPTFQQVLRFTGS